MFGTAARKRRIEAHHEHDVQPGIAGQADFVAHAQHPLLRLVGGEKSGRLRLKAHDGRRQLASTRAGRINKRVVAAVQAVTIANRYGSVRQFQARGMKVSDKSYDKPWILPCSWSERVFNAAWSVTGLRLVTLLADARF